MSCFGSSITAARKGTLSGFTRHSLAHCQAIPPSAPLLLLLSDLGAPAKWITRPRRAVAISLFRGEGSYLSSFIRTGRKGDSTLADLRALILSRS